MIFQPKKEHLVHDFLESCWPSASLGFELLDHEANKAHGWFEDGVLMLLLATPLAHASVDGSVAHALWLPWHLPARLCKTKGCVNIEQVDLR